MFLKTNKQTDKQLRDTSMTDEIWTTIWTVLMCKLGIAVLCVCFIDCLNVIMLLYVTAEQQANSTPVDKRKIYSALLYSKNTVM